MYHLEGEMAYSKDASSLGKLFSWMGIYDFYQVLMEKKNTFP